MKGSKEANKMKDKGTVVVASGYMNPLHAGHINYLEAAKELGDYLVVIVNSDYQVKLKGSAPFMNEQDRMKIVKAIRYVDEVVLSIDRDKSQCKTLEMIHPDIFANGGDRHAKNIPEYEVCKKLGIEMVDGVGGRKIRSSSELVRKLK